MFKQLQEVLDYVKAHAIRAVDLKFTDLWGKWHHVTLSAQEFSADLMASGVGFDGSSVGFKNVKSGDMALIPDLSSGFREPFSELPALSFICNMVEADTKELFAGDPRQVARKAANHLTASGFADASLWGPEFEFYVFSRVEFENSLNACAYRLDALEGHWNAAKSGHGHHLPLHEGYHAIPPADQLFDLRNRMMRDLEDIGIPVKYHHHEVGGPGQCEIETPMLNLVEAADACMVVKYVTRLVARQAGQTLTYMPKPLFGEAGNGMHFHMQLFLGGKNVFYQADMPYLLSARALHFIGGLLTHAPAVLAFTNASTNSYRRLVPGYEAPVNAFFSSGNRSAAIRIPKYATQPDQVRFEFRPPDATCNPYLAIAAMLMAGIDGMQREIDPSKAGFGPIDEDVFSLPAEQRARIRSLPTDLEDALRALDADNEFLTAGGVFTPGIIQAWIKGKRKEQEAVRVRPHPYELQLYYDL